MSTPITELKICHEQLVEEKIKLNKQVIELLSQLLALKQSQKLNLPSQPVEDDCEILDSEN